MEKVASSPNVNLPDTPFHLHNGWVVFWNNSLGIYVFRNSQRGIAQEQWPFSTEDATFIQLPHGILNAGMATREEKILKLLSSIELSRYHIDQSIHSGVMDVSSNSARLKSRLQYYTSEMQNDTVVAFAELVESMEEEHRALVGENAGLVEFLYERLREARATILKLSDGEPVREEEDLGTSQVIAGGESSSRMTTKLGNISSTSFDPALVQPTTSKIPNRSQSPEMVTQPLLVNIQVDESQAETSHGESTNTVARDTISSTLKRKRRASKDPAKFKHECETCRERFTRSTTLREHQRSHNDERPFPCRKGPCSKSFARTKDRNRHEELHIGQKSYRCYLPDSDTGGQCGRKFAREDGLVAHWRTEKGWKCLLPELEDFERTYFRYGSRITATDAYYCRLTSDACGTPFTQVEDLKAHLMDSANKKCVAEWLIKSALDEGRSYQAVSKRILHVEKHVGEEGSPDDQEVKSRSPPHDTTQPVESTSQTLFQHIKNGAQVSLPDSFAGSITADDEQEAVASSSQDGLRSLDESDPDFDPFDGWKLHKTRCVVDEYDSNQIFVDIKCARKPTGRYRIIIKTFEQDPLQTDWYPSVPGVYIGRLSMEDLERNAIMDVILQGKAVYVMYDRHRAPAKTFRIGTLDTTDGNWRIIPCPERTVSAVSRLIHEIVEEQMPASEHSSMVVTRNSSHGNHRTEQSRVIEEVINDLSQPTDELLPEQETRLGPLNFSKWTLLGSGFDKNLRVIWVDVQCPDLEAYSKSLHFKLGTLLSGVRVVRCETSFSRSFHLYICIKDVALNRSNDQFLDLMFREPGGGFGARLPLGALRWSDIANEWALAQL